MTAIEQAALALVRARNAEEAVREQIVAIWNHDDYGKSWANDYEEEAEETQKELRIAMKITEAAEAELRRLFRERFKSASRSS